MEAAKKLVPAIVVLLIFLALPMITGESDDVNIEHVNLTWNGGVIEHVNPGADPRLKGDLTILISSDEEIGSLEVDFDELNPESIQSTSRTLDLSESNGLYEATVDQIDLEPHEDNPTIEITVGDYEFEEEINLVKVDDEPYLSSIDVEGCEGDDCYVAPGQGREISLSFSDSEVGFGKFNWVRFDVNGNINFVDNCDGTSCTGSFSVSCDGTEEMELVIGDSRSSNQGLYTRDDAASRISRSDSVSKDIICDSTIPEITNVEFERSSGEGSITAQDTFIATVNVSEEVSDEITIMVNQSSIGLDEVAERTCSGEGEFECAIELTSNVDSFGEYELDIVAEDRAGNQDVYTAELTLLEEDEDIPEFWGVSSEEVSSPTINLDNFLMQRDIFTEVELTSDDPNARIRDVEVGSCSPVNDEVTGNQDDVSDHRITTFSTDNDKIVSRASLAQAGSDGSRYEGMGYLEYECELRVYSEDDVRLYRNPENVNYTMRINLESGGSVGSNVQEEIESSMDQVESYQTTIDALRTVNQVAQGSCTVSSALGAAEAGLSTATFGVGTAARANPLLEPAAQSLNQGINNVRAGRERYDNSLGFLCRFASCDPGFGMLDGGLDSLADDFTSDITGYEEVSAVFGVDNMRETLNPYNSEIVAYAYTCLPAIEYHRTTRMGTECGYQECLSKGVGQMGESISSCRAQRDYANCLRHSRNIMNAIPLTSFMNHAMDSIETLVTDKWAAIGAGLDVICGGIVDISFDLGDLANSPIQNSLCGGYKGVTDSIEAMNQLERSMAMFMEQDTQIPSCQRVDDMVDPGTGEWMLEREDSHRDAFQPADNNYDCDLDGRCGGEIEDTKLYLDPSLYANEEEVQVLDDDVPIYDEEGTIVGYYNHENPEESVVRGGYRGEGVDFIRDIENYEDDFEGILDVSKEQERDFRNFLDNEFGEGSGEAYDLLHAGSGRVNELDLDDLEEHGLLDEEHGLLDEDRQEVRERYNDYQNEIDDAQERIDRLKEAKSNDKVRRGLELKRETSDERIDELIEREREDIDEAEDKRDEVANEFEEEFGFEIDEVPEDVVEQMSEELQDRLMLYDSYGTWAKTARSAWGTAYAVSSFRNSRLLGLDIQPENWMGDIGEGLLSTFDGIREYTEGGQLFCGERAENVNERGRGSTMSSSRALGGLTTGANIVGSRTPESDARDGYEYFLAGGVSIERGDLYFDVVLRESNRVEVITDEIGGVDGEIEDGGDQTFGGMDVGTLSLEFEREYDEVCIDFHDSESDLRQHFESLDGLSSGMLCSDIIVEGENRGGWQ